MRMDQIKKLLYGIYFCFMLTSLLGRSVETKAAGICFPYFADPRPVISTGTIKNIIIQKITRGHRQEEEASDSVKNKGKKKGKMKRRKRSLSKTDKELLYKVVSMECDTGYEGSLAVISCMLNRQASDKYPDDLMEVVKEDSQFTAYYDKESDTYPYVDRKPSRECIAAVNDALEKGKRNIPSYIYYFRSSDYEYLNGYITYGQIGDNTYFYQYEDR